MKYQYVSSIFLELRKSLSVSISCFILCNSMSSRIVLKNCLYGINVNEGPLFFASAVTTGKNNFNYVTHENIQDSEILNCILYHLCNVASPQEDIVKTRINDRKLEQGLRAKLNQSASIWSSFLLVKNSETLYRSSWVVKFKNEDEGNTQQFTGDIIDFARSFEIPFISKLVPTVGKLGYTVNVIPCASQSWEKIDPFEILPVKYCAHHPSFDFGHSIFKSFEETRSMLDLADCHLTIPEIKKLKRIADVCSRKAPQMKDVYPNPFIVVEGLDAVGKSLNNKDIYQ